MLLYTSNADAKANANSIHKRNRTFVILVMGCVMHLYSKAYLTLELFVCVSVVHIDRTHQKCSTLDAVEKGFAFQSTTIDVDLYLSKVYNS